MPQPQRPDPSLCPLCERSNACGAVRGEAASCWCHAAQFPPSLLETLPREVRGKQCICQRCAEAGATGDRKDRGEQDPASAEATPDR